MLVSIHDPYYSRLHSRQLQRPCFEAMANSRTILRESSRTNAYFWSLYQGTSFSTNPHGFRLKVAAICILAAPGVSCRLSFGGLVQLVVDDWKHGGSIVLDLCLAPLGQVLEQWLSHSKPGPLFIPWLFKPNYLSIKGSEHLDSNSEVDLRWGLGAVAESRPKLAATTPKRA